MMNTVVYKMDKFIDIFQVNFAEEKHQISKSHISHSTARSKLFQTPG